MATIDYGGKVVLVKIRPVVTAPIIQNSSGFSCDFVLFRTKLKDNFIIPTSSALFQESLVNVWLCLGRYMFAIDEASLCQ